MQKKEFKRLMKCGHGRCVKILESGRPEKYRDIVLYGCVNDLSFDMQCEGSRGIYMYNLVRTFNDDNYFIRPAAEKFMNMKSDGDDRLFQHLCDFLSCFAGNGNQTIFSVLMEKYKLVYKDLMNTRKSVKRSYIADNYSYLCIILMQISDSKTLFLISDDIGKYFIKNSKCENDLKSVKADFEWFYDCTKEKYGELNKSDLSESAEFFLDTMETKTEYSRIPIPYYSAEDIFEKAKDGKISRLDIMRFSRSDNEEKIKLAGILIAETNNDIKANILKVFTSRYNVFPFSAEILIEYAESDNENLKNTALDTLTYIKQECVHVFALNSLKKEISFPAVLMLIKNYHESDKLFLLDFLNGLKIDYTEKSGWHTIIFSLLDAAKEKILPDEFITFIYEKSLCSCCREYALNEMSKRNILTDKIIEECLFDCNNDIRQLVGLKNKKN